MNISELYHHPGSVIHVRYQSKNPKAVREVRIVKMYIPQVYQNGIEADIALLKMETRLVSDFSVFPHIRVGKFYYRLFRKFFFLFQLTKKVYMTFRINNNSFDGTIFKRVG